MTRLVGEHGICDDLERLSGFAVTHPCLFGHPTYGRIGVLGFCVAFLRWTSFGVNYGSEY